VATASLMRAAHPTVPNRLIIGFNAIDALCHVSLTLISLCDHLPVRRKLTHKECKKYSKKYTSEIVKFIIYRYWILLFQRRKEL